MSTESYHPTVSVIVPSYNGRALLQEHLPAVLNAMRNEDELIVIDDQSSDNSWEWLQKKFPSIQTSFTHKKKDSLKFSFDGEILYGSWKYGQKNGSVILLRNQQNKRFAESCNQAVQQATHSLVFLINSDVSPHPDTIHQLTTHFANPSIFAVSCLEHEHDPLTKKEVFGGKNVLEFKRGMFVHRRADHFETGETGWASGGSSMFDREKWLALEGFSADYYPAYWEDVDLSFRAKKNGWKVLFDQKAEVDHDHESTNTSEFGRKKMTNMSWQHANTFIKKNATWKQKLDYLFWQPYWWTKAPILAPLQLQILFAGLILLVAIVLRFYQLGQVPHGMTWDEAAIGYNGFAVATTGRDEWLKKLPISFQSFGDYKAPLAIYVTGVSVRLFGLNLWAVRLPFALSGVLAVIGWMVVVKLLWEEWMLIKKESTFPVLTSTNAALLSGVLITASAWHLHFSRVGFESGMALNFLIWGVAGLVFVLSQKTQKLRTELPHFVTKLIWLMSSMLLAASLYTYHSSKIVTPLLLLTLGWLFRSKLKTKWRATLLWCLVFIIYLLPLAIDSIWGAGADRFQQASIFREGLALPQLLQKFTQHFTVHFRLSYLIQGQTPTLRHGDGQWGILYPTELFLVVVAGIAGVQNLIRKRRSGFLTAVGCGILWVIIGTIPAAIGVDVPHSNRMLLALPGFLFLAVLGWQFLAEKLKGRLIGSAVLGTTLLLHLFFLVSYLNHYYGTFAKTSADEFKDGYLEAVEYSKHYEPTVEKILFTSSYEQPYIYALFGRGTSPYEYHGGSLIKYEFTNKITVGDLITRHNTLIIATPAQLEPKLAEHLIYGSNGSIRFVVVKVP